MAQRHATVDDYIASFPAEVQPILQAVRETVRAAAGGATEEAIRYDMPVVSVDGAYVVHFAGWKRHIGLYPVLVFTAADDELERAVAPHRSGKDSVRFPFAEPIPHALIARIVQAIVARRPIADGA